MMKIFYTIFTVIIVVLVTSCEKQYKPDLSNILQNATSIGTLSSATPAAVDYLSGIAVTNNHKVAVQVNISTVGTYAIHTDTVNNVWFDATGTVNNTGSQTLTLQAHGTPDSSGICNFTVKYGTSNTGFSTQVFDWWEFQEQGGNKYTGKMDSIYINDDPGFNVLFFEGTGNAPDIKMVIAIDIDPTTNPVVGNYSTNMGTLGFFTYAIVDPNTGMFTTQFYNSDRLQNTTSTTIQVNSYNSTTRMLDATFTGSAVTNTGATVNIINGRLRAKFRP